MQTMWAVKGDCDCVDALILPLKEYKLIIAARRGSRSGSIIVVHLVTFNDISCTNLDIRVLEVNLGDYIFIFFCAANFHPGIFSWHYLTRVGCKGTVLIT
jgi:DUF971 family protein